jgi:photosystem II stability/assembly factor-like uncharacterized protein
MTKVLFRFMILIFLLELSSSLHAYEIWQYLGQGDKIASKLYVNDNELFALTNNGLFKRSLDASDTSWISLSLEDDVKALMIFNADTMLASVQTDESSSDTISIYRTEDGGSTWIPFQNGFGAAGGTYRTVVDFTKSSGQNDTIYAASHGSIYKSIDGGQSWSPKYTEGGILRFIEVDPVNSNIIWAGGSMNIGWSKLLKSDDYGETWNNVFFPSMPSCSDIAIDHINSDHIFIPSMRLYWTDNGGADWQDTSLTSLYTRCVHIDSENSNIIYTAGVYSGGLLGFYKSVDDGSEWDVYHNSFYSPGNVWDLMPVTGVDRFDLYFATDNGVYRYTDTDLIICGDANFDATVNVSDAVWIINYVFIGGDPPIPYEAGDVNCDGTVNVSDAVWIINYVFVGGNDPCDC